AAELVHPDRAAFARVRERARVLRQRALPRGALLLRAGAHRRAARVLAAASFLAVRRPLVGSYLPARRAGFRRCTLRAGPPFCADARARRGDAAARDAFRPACACAYASQRCMASGVNSAFGSLPPITN